MLMAMAFLISWRLNPTVNVNLNVNVNAKLDLGLINPNYVFATPVLGGQLAVGVMGIVGTNNTAWTAP